jgi:hypothetical protein
VDDTVTVAPMADAPGLLLRPWNDQDIPALVAAHRDPVIRRWLRHRVTTVEEARQVIAIGNQASCRVADKAGFAFSAVMPPLPPEFPQDGHLHIRSAGQEV